jgi:hypothetical protein
MSQGPSEICTAIDKQMRGDRRLAAVAASGCYRIVLIDFLWFTPKMVDGCAGVGFGHRRAANQHHEVPTS